MAVIDRMVLSRCGSCAVQATATIAAAQRFKPGDYHPIRMTTRPTSTERKKQRERSLFDRVRPFIHEWSEGAVDDAQENPDIVIAARGLRVGVEVTETVNNEVRSEIENRRIVCGDAQVKYQAATGVVGLEVKALFRLGALSNKAHRAAASFALEEIVREAFPATSPQKFARRLEITSGPAAVWFSTVYLHFHPALTRSIWQAPAAGWTPALRAEGVQAEIARKEPRLSAYRRRADVVWLLIATNGILRGSAAQIDDEVMAHEFSTSFDGVVLFDEAMQQVEVLKTRRVCDVPDVQLGRRR